MAAPKGHARYGGRAKGTLNKSTADIKALAQKHGGDVIAMLAKLMQNADSDQAKIAAGKELLDRGYGKPTQVIGGDDELPITVVTKIALSGPS